MLLDTLGGFLFEPRGQVVDYEDVAFAEGHLIVKQSRNRDTLGPVKLAKYFVRDSENEYNRIQGVIKARGTSTGGGGVGGGIH